jgi:hypothetical protein
LVVVLFLLGSYDGSTRHAGLARVLQPAT